MLDRKILSGGVIAGLLLLGACSGKSDTAGNEAAIASNTTQAAAVARMPKAGLWEMTMTAAGLPAPMKMQTCLGEPAPGSNPFAPPAPPGQNCARNKITPTSDGYTIDMECSANGMTTSVAGTVAGDFNSKYRVDLTTKVAGANLPAAAQKEVKSAVDSTYVGACPAGMKVGETKPVS